MYSWKMSAETKWRSKGGGTFPHEQEWDQKKKKKSIYSQRTLGSEWSLELDKGIQETL